MKTLHPNDLVCDAATPKDEAGLVAHGYKAIARYITGDPNDWREITPAEIVRIVAAGLGLWLIWETGANRALDGAAAGTSDGRRARWDADRLGFNGTIIIATTDFDVTPATIGQVMAYCRAFKAACGLQVGIYADTDIVNASQPGEFSPMWRPAASWWSRQGGDNYFVHPLTDIKQGFTGELVPGVDHGVVLRGVQVWTGVVPKPTDPSVEVPKWTLKVGSRGPEVGKLQREVNFWGALQPAGRKFSCGPADDIFGPQTAAGVRGLQRALKVYEDGEYGPQTGMAYRYFKAVMVALSRKK